jgi:hypothetical protein
MAKEKKKYIFYGSPFRSKVKTEEATNGKIVAKVITPYVVMEFESMRKAKRFLDKQSWNLPFHKDGITVQFVVLTIEEV